MVDRVQSAHIMVVDDEASERVSLAEVLKLEEYQVDTAASGEEALSLLGKSTSFDLILLDLKMPGMDGLEVIDAVRKRSPGTVVILLTAFGTLETAMEAIKSGAHDYLLKPCPVPDILESVRKGLIKYQQEKQRQQLVNQLQHTISELATVEGAEEIEEIETSQSSRFIEINQIVVDRQKHVVMRDEQPVDLTPTEFKILVCLMETPDQVWSPQELVRNAQGYETDAWGARAIIRVHIRRLRKKIEAEPSNPECIINVRGVGYMFASGSSKSN